MRMRNISSIFLTAFVLGVMLFFSACRAEPAAKPTSGFIYATVFQNGTPSIENESIILDGSDPDRNEVHIFLEYPELYDASSIFWRIPGTDITSEGAVFSLEAIWFKNPGAYYINVAVKIDGVPFNRTFELLVLVSEKGAE